MLRVAINHGPRVGWAYVRQMCGSDEESVDATDTASAIALVDRLLVAVPGAAVLPGEASALVAADRDRVLAAIYVRELGPRVQTSPACTACAARFDLDFELDAAIASLAPGERARDAAYRTASGCRFRLPTGEDELCAAGADDPLDALLARCHLDGPLDREAMTELMERVAPLVELELAASCPVCGAGQQLQFDIQRYLLGALVGERRKRTGEVHRLARTLGWSLTELMSLTRAQRALHGALADQGSTP